MAKKLAVHYAGFWIRFVATFIDLIPSFILLYLWGFIGNAIPSLWIRIVVQLVGALLSWLFLEVWMTSRYGGSVGKLLLGIHVVNVDHQYLAFWHSFGRALAKIVSELILGIGFLMICWTDGKKGLHDYMASTTVEYNPKSPIDAAWRKRILVLAIIWTAAYIIYTVVMGTLSVVVFLHTMFAQVDASNPMQSIDADCANRSWFTHDLCYQDYASEKYADLDGAAKLAICNRISSEPNSLACWMNMANLQQDRSLCYNARTPASQAQCAKGYDTLAGFMNFSNDTNKPLN